MPFFPPDYFPDGLGGLAGGQQAVAAEGGYWHGPYFGPYQSGPYWGQPGAIVGAATLLRAIVDRATATAGLGDPATLPGGFVAGKVPNPSLQATPYGELHEIREGYWYGTVPGGLLADDTHLQAEFYGADVLALKQIKVAWEAAFHPRMAPLPVRDRLHVTCFPVQAFLETDVAREPDQAPLARQVIEFRVVQSR